jgi:hypothetical protein
MNWKTSLHYGTPPEDGLVWLKHAGVLTTCNQGKEINQIPLYGNLRIVLKQRVYWENELYQSMKKKDCGKKKRLENFPPSTYIKLKQG